MQVAFAAVGFAKPRALLILFGFLDALPVLPPTLLSMYLTNADGQQCADPRNSAICLLYIVGFCRGVRFWPGCLTWARTYVLAWASEAIAADLRNHTYSHLQTLSIDYFGGKRTGDLIARVSTDTDRIYYFLSVYLLDFANDLVMLLMTAAFMLYDRSEAGDRVACAVAGNRISGAQGAQPFAAEVFNWAAGPGAK